MAGQRIEDGDESGTGGRKGEGRGRRLLSGGGESTRAPAGPRCEGGKCRVLRRVELRLLLLLLGVNAADTHARATQRKEAKPRKQAIGADVGHRARGGQRGKG